MEPTERSHRPCQLPEMMESQAGVAHCTFTPSRLAISVATSMSKPFQVLVFESNDDCGGYLGSVETFSTPVLWMCDSRSLPPLELDLLHPAATIASTVTASTA